MTLSEATVTLESALSLRREDYLNSMLPGDE